MASTTRSFGRADFVLHFHGFDDEEPLAGFDGIAGFDEQANNFAGHRGDDLLAAFDFEGAVTATAPGAGIDDLGGEFFEAGLQGERSAGRRSDANFVRLAAKKDGESVGRDFDGVGVEGLTVECERSSSTMRVFAPMRTSNFTECGPEDRGGLRVSSGRIGRSPCLKRTGRIACPTGGRARARRR